MPLNFVKFQRGTQAQYNSLKTANRLESDALYFIYNSQAPQDGGLLYMGDVLIGGTGVAGASALSELTDVGLSGVTLLDGMVLQYNAGSHKWEPVAGADLLPVVQSTTSTEGQTPAQAAAAMDTTPIEGDIVFVDGSPMIYNGSSWQPLIGNNLESRVATLETSMAAVPGQIDSAIASANHLSYSVVSTLPTITNENAGSLTNTVFLVPNGETTGDNRYEEYMVVNGNFEKVGDFGADLSNYVTTSTLNTQVVNLNTAINNLYSTLTNDYLLAQTYYDQVGDISDLQTATGDNNITVIDELVDLHDRLLWHDMT